MKSLQLPKDYTRIRYFREESNEFPLDSVAFYLKNKQIPVLFEEIQKYINPNVLFKFKNGRLIGFIEKLILKEGPLNTNYITESCKETYKNGAVASEIGQLMTKHPAFTHAEGSKKNGMIWGIAENWFTEPVLRHLLVNDEYDRFHIGKGDLVVLAVWTHVCERKGCSNWVLPRGAQKNDQRKRFCSRDCQYVVQVSDGVSYTCDNCGTERTVKTHYYNALKAKSESGKIFCGGDCQKEWMRERRSELMSKGREAEEMVNHPSHYGGGENVYEVIKVMEAWAANWGPVTATLLTQTMKYIGRHHMKGKPLEDLKKASWYLTREIERLEK